MEQIGQDNKTKVAQLIAFLQRQPQTALVELSLDNSRGDNITTILGFVGELDEEDNVVQISNFK